MELKLAENKEEWESWFQAQENAEFLQSWEWGEFQKSVGNEPIRLVFEEGNERLGQMQGFVENLLPGMKSLYFPRFSFFGRENLQERIVGWLKEQNFTSCRFEPVDNDVYPNARALPPRQPQATLILSLNCSKEDILNQMHSKTRYNIRLAEKKDVLIRDEKNPEIFWELMKVTSERDEFRSHEKKYYEKMLNIPFVRQLTAYFNGKAIASILLVQYAKRWTYLHGASSNEYRNVMAPYLLQWKAIEMAKEQGGEEYDFWGIAKEADEKEQEIQFHTLKWNKDDKLSAVTRFKSGFGGTRKNYPSAQEIVFKKNIFSFYKIVRKILHR